MFDYENEYMKKKYLEFHLLSFNMSPWSSVTIFLTLNLLLENVLKRHADLMPTVCYL